MYLCSTLAKPSIEHGMYGHLLVFFQCFSSVLVRVAGLESQLTNDTLLFPSCKISWLQRVTVN